MPADGRVDLKRVQSHCPAHRTHGASRGHLDRAGGRDCRAAVRGRRESKILCRQSGPREPGVLWNTGGKRNAPCIQADLRAPLDLRFRAGPERTRCRWALPRASNCGRQRFPDLPARRGPLASREGRRGTLESLPVDQGRFHRRLHGDRLQERFLAVPGGAGLRVGVDLPLRDHPGHRREIRRCATRSVGSGCLDLGRRDCNPRARIHDPFRVAPANR